MSSLMVRRALAPMFGIAILGATALGCSKTTTTDASTNTTGTTAASTTASTAARADSNAGGTSGKGESNTGGSSGKTSASTTSAGSGSKASVAIAPEDAAFCATAKKAEADAKSLDPSKSPSDYLASLKASFAELTKQAPADLQADMKTLNDAIQSLTSLEQMQALEQQPAVKAANDHLESYGKSHCGI